jgi:class 3 adenylate cyclase
MSASISEVRCRSCGASNRMNAKFCGQCGTSLAPELVCGACGAPSPPGQRFCDECGAPLVPGAHAARGGRALPTAFASGRYEVLRFVGEGGRKRVYLATDTRLHREVAVSVFKSEGVDETALQRARREAEAMARLGDHPNVVTIHDIGEEDGELFLVSQYMSGGDLTGLLAQAEGHRLAIDEVVRIGTDIARALECAHDHQVIHRDIKPKNIWLAPDGTAKLGDFGLAIAAERTRLTVEGMMVGTVAYMPPEQALGRPADARSDLYSLGAVMYELLCGVPPFVGDDAASVISQHLSTTPVAPTWHRRDVPRALEQLVLKLLAKSPEQRLQTAADVRIALEQIRASSSSSIITPEPESVRALAALSDGVFLGRESETRQLRAAVDEALAGGGRVFLVAGEAGIGKTRLASEIETYANLRGAHVLWGRCYEGEGAPAYWPWVQVIRSYVQTREPDALRSELGSGASDIAQVVSELREVLPDMPEVQPLGPEEARFRLFDSITTFLRNASSTRPLAIFLEDLHLADTPSVRLLEFLARELTSARIFVLGTYRDVELGAQHPLDAIHGSLSHERTYQRIRLRGLTEAQVKALMEALSRQTLEQPGELALVEAVYRESAGNPFFIEEILRHLVESGGIYYSDGRWVSDADDIQDLGIPQGIRDVIDRRVSRLTADCRELLTIASVIGHEFGLEVLEHVSELPLDRVLDLLHEAADAALVAQTPGELNRFRFGHLATRDALYQALSHHRQIALHQAVGDALEELYEDRIESHLSELAYHFARAAPGGQTEKAADYAWWAGERAASVGAHEEAVEQYSRALRMFDTAPSEPVRRCELLLALGDARWRAGQVDGAREVFLEAAEMAEQLSLADQYARAALGFGGGPGGFKVADSEDSQLVELLRRALDLIGERDSLLKVRVLGRLAVELSYTSDDEERDAVSRAAVEIAERLGDARILLLALYSRQWAMSGPDAVDADLAAGAEVVRLARVVGDREMEFRGHQLGINTLLQLGDIAKVDREIRACEKLAGDMRQPLYQWQAAVFRVMRAIMQSRFKEGERLAQSAFSLGRRAIPETATIVFGVHTFLTSWAIASLAPLRDGGVAFAERYPHTAWPSAVTWLLTEIGELDDARARFNVLARDGFRGLRRDANWLTRMATLSLACLALEEAEAAESLYALLEPYAERYTPILTGAAFIGSNHSFLGHTALAAGRVDASIGHLERALVLNARIGAHLFGPRMRGVLARALTARGAPGDAERAERLVQEALEQAQELGMGGEVERLLSIKLGRQGLVGVDPQTSIDQLASFVQERRPDLAPATAPDGTVTIMFSEIEDSMALTEQLGDAQWLALLKRHNELVRREVGAHGGYEVKSQADGFMVAFASARRAVECAIAVQRALAEHRRVRPTDRLNVRIGLHTGEAMRAEEDFFGKNVVLSARIAASAAGGEILVSSLLRELVASVGAFQFGPGRDLELKGLSGSYRVYEVDYKIPISELSPTMNR